MTKKTLSAILADSKHSEEKKYAFRLERELPVGARQGRTVQKYISEWLARTNSRAGRELPDTAAAFLTLGGYGCEVIPNKRWYRVFYALCHLTEGFCYTILGGKSYEIV